MRVPPKVSPAAGATAVVDRELAEHGAARVDAALQLLLHTLFDPCPAGQRCGFADVDAPDDLLWIILRGLEHGLADLHASGIRRLR